MSPAAIPFPKSALWRLTAIAAMIGGSAAQATNETAPTHCEALAAERAQLQGEGTAINRTITDLAFGRTPKLKKGVKAGDVGQAVLGTAASVLLPFGLGAALNLGVSAARRSGQERDKSSQVPSVAPTPDVPALIAREGVIRQRLAQIETKQCVP